MATSDTPPRADRDDGVIATLAATIVQHVAIEHPPDVRPVTRDAHPKAHRCVRAVFTVDDTVGNTYGRGIFVPGRRYEAWIRFSNALKIRHDLVRDARGMAVKVLNVDGPNETPGCTTQDFLLVTHPAFFVSNAREYVDFPSTVFRSYSTVAFYLRVGRYFFGLRPWRFRWRGAWALLRSLKWTSSPLVVGYFSQAPFRFGDREAKFCALPRQRPGAWPRLRLLLRPFPASTDCSRSNAGRTCLATRSGARLRGHRRHSTSACSFVRTSWKCLSMMRRCAGVNDARPTDASRPSTSPRNSPNVPRRWRWPST
jgi:hypothetical protein